MFQNHKVEIILCFVLTAVLATTVFLILLLARYFKKPRSPPSRPTPTDLDTLGMTIDFSPEIWKSSQKREVGGG